MVTGNETLLILMFTVVLSSTVILSSNEEMKTAIFLQSIKNYQTKKAYRKTKYCLSYRQSFGLSGASCYLCQYSLFFEPPAKKVTGKK